MNRHFFIIYNGLIKKKKEEMILTILAGKRDQRYELQYDEIQALSFIHRINISI